MMADRPFGFPPVKKHAPSRKQSSFDEFDATELYCPQCRQAVPVRKSLLLILPEGDKYEYRCAQCGSVVGDKMDKSGQFYSV